MSAFTYNDADLYQRNIKTKLMMIMAEGHIVLHMSVCLCLCVCSELDVTSLCMVGFKNNLVHLITICRQRDKLKVKVEAGQRT